MREHDLPEIPVSVAAPIFTRRTLILYIDLSQKPELRPALAQLTAENGWLLRFCARDANTGEQFISLCSLVVGHDAFFACQALCAEGAYLSTETA